jgi:peptidoglycan hydrolase CwlO-like protein
MRDQLDATRQEKDTLATELQQYNKNLHDEIKHLNANINECQKRESSLKDQVEVARQDKEKLIADSQIRE